MCCGLPPEPETIPPRKKTQPRSLIGSITSNLPPIPKPSEIAEAYGINLASIMVLNWGTCVDSDKALLRETNG